MAGPKAKGRMIRRDLSLSRGFAALSPPAAVLFCVLIPNYNAYGKMNGDPLYVKAEVVPRLDYLTPEVIAGCLHEINLHTNVKWFQYEGLWYLHSLSWDEHQELRADRRGQDALPSYPNPRTTPGVLPPEVEVECKEKEKGSRSGSATGSSESSALGAGLSAIGQEPRPEPKRRWSTAEGIKILGKYHDGEIRKPACREQLIQAGADGKEADDYLGWTFEFFNQTRERQEELESIQRGQAR